MDEKTQIDPFTPSQKVWLLDTAPTEVDKIRGSLTPEVETFDTYGNLAKNISSRLSLNTFGTLIVTGNLSADIETHFSSLVGAINNESVVDKIFVFHITRETISPFKQAKIYKDVDSFLDDANNIHLESVATSTDVNEEAQNIIRSLQTSKNKYQAKYEQTLQEKEELEKELQVAKDSVKNFEGKIAYYEQKISDADELSAESKKTVEDNQAKLDNLTTGLDQSRAKVAEYEDKIIELQAKLEGERDTVKELSSQNNILEVQIQDKETELQDVREQNQRLLSAKTEVEGMSELQASHRAMIEKNEALKQTIKNLKQDKVVLENKVDRYQDDIEKIRKGYRDYSQVGYSNVFQTIELKETNVLYFKVLESLPYHRFYIQKIAEILRSLVPATTHVVTCMLKVDQEKDRERFGGEYTFISDLSGINGSHDNYYLIPSKRMGENVEEFEKSNTILILIDYIDNDKYYLETKGLIDYYHIEKDSRVESKVYGLKGLPISYDHRSVLDIKYNRSFESLSSENKEEYINNRVADLMSKSAVVASCING